MQQFCQYGSVRGATGNRRPYRDKTYRLVASWRSEGDYRVRRRGAQPMRMFKAQGKRVGPGFVYPC